MGRRERLPVLTHSPAMVIPTELFRPMRPTALCLVPLLAGGASAAEHTRRLLAQASEPVQPTTGSETSIAGALAGAIAAFLMVALVLAIFLMRKNAAQKILPERSEDGSVGKGKKSLSKKGDDSEAAPQTSLIYMTFNDVQVRSTASPAVPFCASSGPVGSSFNHALTPAPPGLHPPASSRRKSKYPFIVCCELQRLPR